MQALTKAVAAEGLDVRFRSTADLAGRDPGSHPENFGARILALPGSPEAVAGLVRLCARLGLPIVPQGGRTGLVGATITRPGQLALSLERMNRIIEIDPASGTALVEAGVTLAALQSASAEHGLEPGIDLGARGTATIGGMVATNAGGMQAFRHGVMRHRTLGVEAVLADGSVLSDLTRVVKSTTGYDVKQLMIGSEGTLGIVTRVAVALVPLPKGSATALLALPDAATATSVTQRLQRATGFTLLTAELMSRDFLSMNAESQGAELPQGMLDSPMTLLIEIGAEDDASAAALLTDEVTALWERFGLTDGIVAQSLSQAKALWHLREEMSVFPRRYPGYISCDISVPPGNVDAYLAALGARLEALEPGLEFLVFAHIADGNLHVIPKRGGVEGAFCAALEHAIYSDLASLGGSMSAEHGIGTKKRQAYDTHVDPVKRALATRLKAALDPDGLFNPGVFGGETPA